jgi:hypothetical protein
MLVESESWVQSVAADKRAVARMMLSAIGMARATLVRAASSAIGAVRAIRRSRPRSHAVTLAWHVGVDSLQKAPQLLDGHDRHKFDTVPILDCLYLLTGVKCELEWERQRLTDSSWARPSRCTHHLDHPLPLLPAL